jgi:hypothetical protein
MGIGCSSCTVVKPVTGLVTGPMRANDELGGGTSPASGCAVIGILAVESAAGVVCGLATGVASDVHVLFGGADEPTRNWANPFRTNTDATAPAAANEQTADAAR